MRRRTERHDGEERNKGYNQREEENDRKRRRGAESDMMENEEVL